MNTQKKIIIKKKRDNPKQWQKLESKKSEVLDVDQPDDGGIETTRKGPLLNRELDMDPI